MVAVRIARNLTLCIVLFALSSSGSLAADKKSKPDPAVQLAKDAEAYRRKAMDCRVLGLNALKNADAGRAKAHAELIKAMNSGKKAAIAVAVENHENAAEELEDVIESVEKVVSCCVSADMAAKDVQALCKEASEAGQTTREFDEKKAKSKLAEAEKALSKVENTVKELKTDWLEPTFATTTTTTTTTSTTAAKPKAAGK